MDAAQSSLQLAGFLLASWAVIGNDSLQTLGPFLQANRGRTPRWSQAVALCGVLCAVLLLGWWRSAGDASWGRLSSYPAPPRLAWLDLLPPLAVLLLTQLGVPVSTSFLVLTAFTPANLPALLRRSLLGYGLALLVGLLVYGGRALWCRLRERRSAAAGCAPPGPALAGGSDGAAGVFGVAGIAAGPALLLQWLASGWLWSQWLIQDLANIFIYLPRQLGAGAMALALAVLCAGVGLLLLEGGGAIQDILRRKSGLKEPAATTAISLNYGLILALLALLGREPLSTTWVFLGLLAGRELGLGLAPQARPAVAVVIDLARDLLLAALGLAVSVALALGLQPLRELI